MRPDKANRACDDMRDGTNKSDNAFIDKGFSQLASRRGAIMLLPNFVRPAAIAKLNQLRAQGLFKYTPLVANLAGMDPWHGAAEVPNIESIIYRLYGLGYQGAIADSQYRRDAKVVNEAWPMQSVGYVAYLNIASAKVATGTLNFPTSEALAKSALTTGESAIDFVGEVNTFIQKAQAERIKSANQLVSINQGIQESQEKPLNDMLSLCQPKSSTTCQQEVRNRFAACDAKGKAFHDANAAVIGNFDSSQGKAAIRQWGDIIRVCQAEIKQFVDALPDGPKGKIVNSRDPFGVDGKIITVPKNDLSKQTGTTNIAPNIIVNNGNNICTNNGNNIHGRINTVPINTPSITPQNTLQSMPTTPNTVAVPSQLSDMGSSSLGSSSLGSSSLGSSSLGNRQNNAVNNQTAQTNATQASAIASVGSVGLSVPIQRTTETVALAQCNAFLGKKDELLCANTNAFNACKAQVDRRQLRACHLVGSQEIYPDLRSR